MWVSPWSRGLKTVSYSKELSSLTLCQGATNWRHHLVIYLQRSLDPSPQRPGGLQIIYLPSVETSLVIDARARSCSIPSVKMTNPAEKRLTVIVVLTLNKHIREGEKAHKRQVLSLSRHIISFGHPPPPQTIHNTWLTLNFAHHRINWRVFKFSDSWTRFRKM